MVNEDLVPYFLWHRNVTIRQLREILLDASDQRRVQLLRALVREARPDDVWRFVSPESLWREWPDVEPGLGRSRPFWNWLMQEWRRLGYLP